MSVSAVDVLPPERERDGTARTRRRWRSTSLHLLASTLAVASSRCAPGPACLPRRHCAVRAGGRRFGRGGDRDRVLGPAAELRGQHAEYGVEDGSARSCRPWNDAKGGCLLPRSIVHATIGLQERRRSALSSQPCGSQVRGARFGPIRRMACLPMRERAARSTGGDLPRREGVPREACDVGVLVTRLAGRGA